jgi:nucleoside-diphosphate-sugar epimerase
MKILMTGGSGFLGRYVQAESINKAHEFESYDMSKGQDILQQDAFYYRCIEFKPDVIIHAAAVADLYKSEENIDYNFSVNVLGTYYIARICSILNIPLIYISTCCAYGNQSENKMVDETIEPIPTETYAWSKLAGEKALGCAGPLKGFILRLGTFYGPGMREALFNAKAILAALDGGLIDVHGDGEQTRRYIHVADVASAIVGFCERTKQAAPFVPNNPLPIYNIIGEEEISVNDTLDIISELTEKKMGVRYCPQRSGQIMRQMINCSAAKSFTGWEPKIDYKSGMAESIKYFKTVAHGTESNKHNA